MFFNRINLLYCSTTPISNPQWQPKTTSVALYAQPHRHPPPSVSRVSRPSSTVYTGQQPRLISPVSQGRSVQATMVTGSPSRLIAPVLQTNITRHPVAQNRPPTPQVVTVSQTSQPTRSSAQTIQVNHMIYLYIYLYDTYMCNIVRLFVYSFMHFQKLTVVKQF